MNIATATTTGPQSGPAVCILLYLGCIMVMFLSEEGERRMLNLKGFLEIALGLEIDQGGEIGKGSIIKETGGSDLLKREEEKTTPPWLHNKPVAMRPSHNAVRPAPPRYG
ncbi:bacterial nucleoid DNA-binding protein [Striga asiatica]|uniref:Bacterial nucleoid DNA-binding protein n=1 Tax=Striga asiatica TaxID=4170 RepID=A0A5A7QQ61_STRAF|nr:bacterial nucleoid DNA-binding protein [Striga asiatica]